MVGLSAALRLQTHCTHQQPDCDLKLVRPVFFTLIVQALKTAPSFSSRKIDEIIVVRSDIHQPLAFDLTHSPYIVPSGHDKLLIQSPANSTNINHSSFNPQNVATAHGCTHCTHNKPELKKVNTASYNAFNSKQATGSYMKRRTIQACGLDRLRGAGTPSGCPSL